MNAYADHLADRFRAFLRGRHFPTSTVQAPPTPPLVATEPEPTPDPVSYCTNPTPGDCPGCTETACHGRPDPPTDRTDWHAYLVHSATWGNSAANLGTPGRDVGEARAIFYRNLMLRRGSAEHNLARTVGERDGRFRFSDSGLERYTRGDFTVTRRYTLRMVETWSAEGWWCPTCIDTSHRANPPVHEFDGGQIVRCSHCSNLAIIPTD